MSTSLPPLAPPLLRLPDVLRERTVLALSVAAAASFTALGMIVPVRVLYAQSHGASLAIIGAMASSYLLSNFLFQYPVGWISDWWGRKRIMIIGLLANAILVLLYLPITDPLLFVALRFVEGILAATFMPAAQALIADAVPAKRRGEAYGLFTSFYNAGFLLGPALGGFLAVTGYATAFIGSSAFRVGSALLVLLLVPSGLSPDTHPASPHERTRLSGLFTRPLIAAYILAFGDYLYLGYDQTVGPLWMRHDLGASVALIGLAFALWSVPGIIVAPFAGRLASRTRISGIILTFGLAQVPLYVAWSLPTTMGPVLVLWIVHSVVYFLTAPVITAWLAAASPPDARARAQSMYNAAGLAGAFLAANTLPFLFGINFRLPIWVMAGGFGVCVLIGGVLIRVSEREGPVW